MTYFLKTAALIRPNAGIIPRDQTIEITCDLGTGTEPALEEDSGKRFVSVTSYGRYDRYESYDR